MILQHNLGEIETAAAAAAEAGGGGGAAEEKMTYRYIDEAQG